MAGTKNDVTVAKNADFTQVNAPNASSSEANGLVTDGKMWIGSTAVNAGGTHINVGSITSPLGTLSVSYSSPNLTIDLMGGGVALEHLTGNTGGSLNPDGSNNINILGATLYTTSGVGSTLTINPRVNAYPITPYVVGPVGAAGYQTIQSAINAANSAGGGIIGVQPGNYTENLTLRDGCHITGITFADAGGGVNITGVHIPPPTGGFVFNNVRLISATHIFSSAVAGSAHLVMGNAEIFVTNGYTFNLPNWTGKLESFDVNAAVGTNDGYVNNTGGAEVDLFEVSVGSGTLNPMIVSGFTIGAGSNIYVPINFQTGAIGAFTYSNFNAPLTFSNNSTGSITISTFSTGANAAITMSSSAAWTVSECSITSSNNPVIAGAGAGTLTLGGITFVTGNNISGTLTLAGATGFAPTVMTNGQLLIGKTNSGAVPGSLTSTGGTITVTQGAGTLNIEVASSGFTWTDVTGATQTIAVENGYLTDRGGGVTYTLPATASIGDTFIIVGKLGIATITPNANQQLLIASSSGTVGATGTVVSTNVGDCITFVCTTSGASTVWRATSVVGNWIVN